MSAQINVYKRYSSAPGNARVVYGQSFHDDTEPVKVELVDAKSIGQAYTFSCPWCGKAYCARSGDRSLVLNCVKCGKQMMVTVEVSGDIDQAPVPARSMEYVPAVPSGQAASAPVEKIDESEWENIGGIVADYALDIWITALTQPSVRTFRAILAHTVPSAKRAYSWMFSSGLISASLAVGILIWKEMEEIGFYYATCNIFVVAPAVILLALVLILFFTIFSGCTHLTAMIFGGDEKYTELSYVMAAYLAPLGLLSGILIHIPYLQCIVPLLAIYSLVLYVMAIKVTYKFGWDSTIASSTIAFVVSAVIIGMVAAVLVVAFASMSIGV